MAKTKEAEKSNRIKDARKITDPAKLDTKGMILAVCNAWDVTGQASFEDARAYLIRLGYGKLRATTKWAREHPAEPKPKKVRKAKPAKKAKRKDPPAHTIIRRDEKTDEPITL